MEDIVIIDDFLTNDELTFTIDIINKEKWFYGNQSGETFSNIRWFGCDLSKNLFFKEYLLHKIENVTNSKWECSRLYANGQTTLLNGEWHIDQAPPNDTYWTALLYVSDITRENVDIVKGHTEFKINNEIKSVEPLKNRLVIFKANISHRGLAPSIPEIFRVSLAWKLKKRG